MTEEKPMEACAAKTTANSKPHECLDPRDVQDNLIAMEIRLLRLHERLSFLENQAKQEAVSCIERNLPKHLEGQRALVWTQGSASQCMKGKVLEVNDWVIKFSTDDGRVMYISWDAQPIIQQLEF